MNNWLIAIFFEQKWWITFWIKFEKLTNEMVWGKIFKNMKYHFIENEWQNVYNILYNDKIANHILNKIWEII